MHEYPFMLFKHGGPHEFHGSNFHIVIVNSFEEEQQAVGNGWFTSSTEALEATYEPVVIEPVQPKKTPKNWSK